MPLGWERINERRSTPNKNVVFIKPLPGRNEATSKDYLERIAAQCLPIMNFHHVSVASLEEYEPNLKFWGRNFNNGEVIQLVLRSPSSGLWLPFNFVQMVMMHELAHCKEMNHSKAFWKARNQFSEEMKALWEKGYTGEGLWGRGVLLENGAFAREQLAEGELLPEHMCGGTFRSRGGRGKRKPKPKITYKEAKERRIKKKFGENGVALGADDATKANLERGKRHAGKPRVAGSARGRELRAAAALARFEVKPETPVIKEEEDLVTDSETESDYEDSTGIDAKAEDAKDIDGTALVDSKGKAMIKVCETDDGGDDVARELQELQAIHYHRKQVPSPKAPRAASTSSIRADLEAPPVVTKPPTTKTEVDHNTVPDTKKESIGSSILVSVPEWAPPVRDHVPQSQTPTSTTERLSTEEGIEGPPDANSLFSCPVCSVLNSPMALTCTVCSHVLKPDFVAGSWRCEQPVCSEGPYINAGDVRICGVCGTRKYS